MSQSHVNWKGKAVVDKIRRAAAAGINETLAECVAQAKNDHPGWNNVTTTAEGSIRVQQPAAAGAAELAGSWGSVGVDYFIHLEYFYGHALHNAADTMYRTLNDRIRRRIS